MSVDSFDLTTPSKPKITKDPDAILDYSFDWSAWLLDAGADAIVTHEIFTSGTLFVESSVESDGVVTVFLSGGRSGKTETATCRITTTGLRADDRTLYFQIRER